MVEEYIYFFNKGPTDEEVEKITAQSTKEVHDIYDTLAREIKGYIDKRERIRKLREIFDKHIQAVNKLEKSTTPRERKGGFKTRKITKSKKRPHTHKRVGYKRKSFSRRRIFR